MQTKTLVIAAVIIAATAGLAIAPLASNAMAAREGSQTTSCVHNGNGDDRCGPGQSSTTVTCTKHHGKYTCTSSR
jgi:hypothetical protein